MIYKIFAVLQVANNARLRYLISPSVITQQYREVVSHSQTAFHASYFVFMSAELFVLAIPKFWESLIDADIDS